MTYPMIVYGPDGSAQAVTSAAVAATLPASYAPVPVMAAPAVQKTPVTQADTHPAVVTAPIGATVLIGAKVPETTLMGQAGMMALVAVKK